MLNDNRKFDYRIKCSFSFVSHSILDFSRNRSSTRWSASGQVTDSVTSSYSALRVNVPLVVAAVAVGGGEEETLDCGQRHHFKGPPKLTIYSWGNTIQDVILPEIRPPLLVSPWPGMAGEHACVHVWKTQGHRHCWVVDSILCLRPRPFMAPSPAAVHRVLTQRWADPQIFSPRPSADSDLRTASSRVRSLRFTSQAAASAMFTTVWIKSSSQGRGHLL